ncbi:MAG: sensor histidine kinase [Phycisphaerales bacterium]|nr:sensor histidine kinase [Phycisphaerales bacterium]
MPRRSRQAASAAVSPVRILLLVLAVAFAVEAAIMLAISAPGPYSARALLLSFLDAVVLIAILLPVLWFVLARPLQRLVRERGELLASLLRAQEEERARLARDLHDELGQQQTAVLLALRSVTEADSLDTARRRAEEARRIAADALEAARRLARGLAPGVLADLGLGPAIDRLCEDLAASGRIQITRDLRIPQTGLSREVQIAAYRIVQEALANALRHADATRIRVRALPEEGGLLVEVSDDGRGLPEDAQLPGPAPGLGLRGMRERVVLLDGSFRAASGPGPGTTISAWLPGAALNESNQHPDRG